MDNMEVVIDMTDEEVEAKYNKELAESDFVSCGDSFSLYLKEIGKYPILTRDEEFKYACAYFNDKDAVAKEKLVNHNLRLVVNIAKGFHNHAIPLIDLVQEGNLGLIRGIENYNPELGYRLTTYCVWWIRQAVQRYIHNNGSTIRIPVHMNEKVYRYRRLVTEFKSNNMGLEPSNEYVMKKLGVDDKSLQAIIQASQVPISLDTPVGEDGDSTYGDFIEAEDRTEIEGEYSSLKSDLAEAMSILSEKEKQVLAYRFGLNGGREHTLEEVGQIFKVTRERIRQIEAKAMRKLKHPSRRRLLEDYIK